MIENLLAWGAQSLILVAVAVLMPILLRARSARAQLILFHMVLFGILALPLLQPWKRLVLDVPVFTVDGSRAATVEPVQAAARGAPVDWEKTATYVLLGGIIARGAWLALGLMRLRRYRRYAEPLAMHSEIPVAVSTDVTSPVTFGLVRPVVLVPPMFGEMPEDQQRAVLTHEFLHVRRRDWLFCLAEEIACAIMWFHPAVWFLVARIRVLREQVVDAVVVAVMQDRQPYVEALLTMAQARPMLDVAAAPLFLRRRDLTDRVKTILESPSISVRRIVCSYACVAVVLVSAGVYSISTFPLVAAPMQNEFEVRGVLTRIDVSRLPQPLQSQLDARLAAYRNAPFTTDLMRRIKADIAAVDPKIEQTWVEESPKVYSVSFAYRTENKVSEPRLVRIDTSRVPEPLRSQVEARVNSFVNAPFTDGLMHSMQSVVALLDRKIAYKWSNEPGGNLSLTFLYDAPAESWEPVFGVLARIDVSSLPEPDRSLMQQRLAKYVNAPYTNALMREIFLAAGVRRNWGLMWRREAPGIFSLTIGSAPTGMSSQIQTTQPDFPSDGEKQIRVGGGVQAHKLKAAPAPIYPPLALQARIQGTVRFNVQIGKDGRVKRMQLISGHPLLVESAKEALSRYEYEPTLLNGEPVQLVTVADVNFSLNN